MQRALRDADNDGQIDEIELPCAPKDAYALSNRCTVASRYLKCTGATTIKVTNHAASNTSSRRRLRCIEASISTQQSNRKRLKCFQHSRSTNSWPEAQPDICRDDAEATKKRCVHFCRRRLTMLWIAKTSMRPCGSALIDYYRSERKIGDCAGRMLRVRVARLSQGRRAPIWATRA